ncbi:MAG: DUF362 domain-containing protein [Chloroflexota bacterium]
MAAESPYRVRAVHCDHLASDEVVYQALKRATDPLTRSWDKIRRARRITIKFNQVFPPDRRQMRDGLLQELVDAKVAHATLRLLRDQNPTAEILCPDTSPEAHHAGVPFSTNVAHARLLQEFGAQLIDSDEPPHRVCPVPGGGLMFRQYLLPGAVVDTDAFVSVAKMKNHAFMGVTLCMKNLFGLPPLEPHGRSRTYFHHIIRLSHVLVDLVRIAQPTLNIVDGLVGQSGREWGGEGRTGDVLLAGDHPVATDACGAHLMGFDPLSDWPNQPFVRDRSSIRIAHDDGYGTADLSRIDFQSEVAAPVAEFRTVETDSAERVRAWRRSTCEQALYYRDHQRELSAQHAGQYILLQHNQVVWANPSSELGHSRRNLAGGRPDSALFLKLADPEEREGEHFEVYEQNLRQMQAQG